MIIISITRGVATKDPEMVPVAEAKPSLALLTLTPRANWSHHLAQIDRTDIVSNRNGRVCDYL